MDGLDAINQVIDKVPDIVIMDITMPNLSGIEATKEILEKFPAMKVIALSIHSGDKFVKGMLEAGAVAYLLKDEVPDKLLAAIDKVSKGEMFLSSGVTRAALKKDKEIIVYNVLQTKLLRPPLMSDYIVRNRIISELEQGIVKPLSLISAGAGFGKSVLLSQWLEQSNHLHAWVSLDDEHNELRVFLLYIVTAIRQVIPGLMNETFNAISGVDLPNIKELKYILFTDLCDIEDDFILVLDDYHNINH